MSVKANIVQLKDVPTGFSCSYGRKFIAERPSKIATIPMGYADGYPRPFSEEARVIVNGKLCPVAGNICMDQFMVDVTDVPGVCVGDDVTLLGRDGEEYISAEEMGALSESFNYEVICDIGSRVPRLYLRGGVIIH